MDLCPSRSTGSSLGLSCWSLDHPRDWHGGFLPGGAGGGGGVLDLGAQAWICALRGLPDHPWDYPAGLWIILVIGMVVSFLVALGVVEWFLIWVRKHGFVPFAVYRIILGIILLVFGSSS